MGGRTATKNAELVCLRYFLIGVFGQLVPWSHVRFVKNERLEWVTSGIKVS